MAELFDIINDADQVIGQATRDEVHGNPDLLHRVVHVLLFSPDGRLYLQRRSLNKDIQPDKWDTSVGGHVDAGESYATAAGRELHEELGISGESTSEPQLEELYKYKHSNEIESEMVQTYRMIWSGDVSPDPDEISEGRFWSIEEIDKADPAVFTPNFLDELARYRAFRRDS